MKRAFALLLALVMVFSFVACAEEKKPAEKKTEEEVQETQKSTRPTEYFQIFRGTVTDNTYTSPYTGVTIKLPGNGWSVTDDETLAKDMGLTTDFIANDLYEALMKTDVLTDFEAMDSETGSTVTATYQLTTTTPSTYLNNVKNKLKSMSGVESEVREENTTTTLGGKEYVTCVIDKEAVGTTSTLYYFVRTTDDGVLVVYCLDAFYGFSASIDQMFS